ncbi:MAG: phage recombination protein Bet [Chroococcidiopsis sp.]
MNQSIVKQEATSLAWTPEQLALIKQQIAKDCTDAELALFGQVCQRTGLDPFSRQIYAIKRNQYNPDTRQKEPKMTIQVSVDGFRAIAARSGLYDGSHTEWCGKDGIWSDVWLGNGNPAAAKTTVYRKGSAHPFIAVAKFNSYAVSYNGKLSGLWEKMPDLMIGKVSESLALRKAFPVELSGLYTTEEFPLPEQSPEAVRPEIVHAEPKSERKQIESALNPLPPDDRSNRLKELKTGVIDKIAELEWSTEEQYKWANKLHGKPSSEWSLQEWSMASVDLQERIDSAANPAHYSIQLGEDF